MSKTCPQCGSDDTSTIWSVDNSDKNSKMKTRLYFKIHCECNDCYFKWNKRSDDDVLEEMK